MGLLQALFGDRSLLTRAEAMPTARWQVRMAVDAEYPDFLSFVGRDDDGSEIVVIRYPAVHTSVYGSETVTEEYRLFVNGRAQEGQATTARRLYRLLLARLDGRVEAYVSEERRKWRTLRAIEEAQGSAPAA